MKIKREQLNKYIVGRSASYNEAHVYDFPEEFELNAEFVDSKKKHCQCICHEKPPMEHDSLCCPKPNTLHWESFVKDLETAEKILRERDGEEKDKPKKLILEPQDHDEKNEMNELRFKINLIIDYLH